MVKFTVGLQGETVYNTVKSPVKVNQSYNIKSGATLYTVPWGNYNQVAGTVSKSNHLKQQSLNKLAKPLIYMGLKW